MGDFMVPVSQNEQSGEIINTNPSQTGHTTLPLPERTQNQFLLVTFSTVIKGVNIQKSRPSEKRPWNISKSVERGQILPPF